MRRRDATCAAAFGLDVRGRRPRLAARLQPAAPFHDPERQADMAPPSPSGCIGSTSWATASSLTFADGGAKSRMLIDCGSFRNGEEVDRPPEADRRQQDHGAELGGDAARRGRRHAPAQRPSQRLRALRGGVSGDRHRGGLAVMARRPRRPGGCGPSGKTTATSC